MLAPSDEIAAAVAQTLAARDRALAREQAVHGLDAMKELDLHALLAEGLRAAGWGVHREVVYPGDAAVGDRDRDRCDIVLTPSPADRLADPVRSARRVAASEGTLFAPLAGEMEARAAAGAVDPADAVWVEIKVVAQHCYRHGVPGPNRTYSGELVSGPGSDIAKLMADGVIRRACVAVVLFAETEEVARHDLLMMTHRLLDKDLPIQSPAIACVPIEDRAGNACVAVAVLELRGLGLEEG